MNILLPIETINREIDFKLVLASILSGRGFKIYIGQHDFLMSLLPELENGLYIGKNIFHRRPEVEKGERYYQLKKRGFDIVYLHEEGAVYYGKEDDWVNVLRRHYDPNFFDEDDRICVWGNFQSRVDAARSRGLNISVTGHPRFDLYKKKWSGYFEDKVAKVKEKFNDYVLIIGSYGYANHGIGVDYVFSEATNYVVSDQENRLDRVGYYTYSTRQMVSIIELTHHLAIRYPRRNFVFRPHPSENFDYYKAVFNGVGNIKVIHDGEVNPWILGAEAVIHDGCTTAIESTLAEIPVINFKAFYSEKYDIWLPNQLGKRATSMEEVFEILDNISEYDFSFSNNPSAEKVSDLFFNFKGDSFEKFLNVVEEKINQKQGASVNPSSSLIGKEYLLQKAKTKLAGTISKESARKIKYHKNKFYGFEQSIIESKFTQAEKVLGKRIQYKLHNPLLIEIQ